MNHTDIYKDGITRTVSNAELSDWTRRGWKVVAKKNGKGGKGGKDGKGAPDAPDNSDAE